MQTKLEKKNIRLSFYKSKASGKILAREETDEAISVSPDNSNDHRNLLDLLL